MLTHAINTNEGMVCQKYTAKSGILRKMAHTMRLKYGLMCSESKFALEKSLPSSPSSTCEILLREKSPVCK